MADGEATAGPAPPEGQPIDVLVVEDDLAIRRFLRAALGGGPYRMLEAATGEEGIERAVRNLPALVILDLGLPDLDGLEVIRRLREWSTVPIVVLSARGQEADKIAALDLGADDYLTKPFGIGELEARIRAALRHALRAASAPEGVLQVDGLQVDLAHRRARIDGRTLRLTPIEWKLLAELAKHAGKVLTHRALLRAVWGPGYDEERHYVRVHMAQLRRKIEADPARPRFLLTEPGVGYRLADE